jgi:hypothetical protein
MAGARWAPGAGDGPGDQRGGFPAARRTFRVLEVHSVAIMGLIVHANATKCT